MNSILTFLMFKTTPLLFMFFLFSCNNEVDPNLIKESSLQAPELSLISPESSNANSSSIQVLASQVLPRSVVHLFSDSDCSVEVKSISASDEEVSVLFDIDSLELGVHQFYVNQEIVTGEQSPCSTQALTFVFENEAPQYMNSITVTSPQSSLGDSSQIEIQISGVTFGHTITLCSDSSCQNILGTVVADSNSVTFSLDLDHGPGDYQFFAKASNSFGSSNIVDIFSYTLSTNSIGGLVVYPERDISTIDGKREGFVNCGQSAGSLEDKVSDCSVKNDGSTLNANDNLWKLVMRDGAMELWLDQSSGNVWSSVHDALGMSAAQNICSNSVTYQIENESWHLPTESEVLSAYSHGFSDIAVDSSTTFWTSSLPAGVSDLVITYSWENLPSFTTGGMRLGNFPFHCVFSSL